MHYVKLQYPVHTIEGKMLLQSGIELTEKVLNDLIRSNNRSSCRQYTLFEYGNLKKDLTEFLEQPPYNLIFSNKGRIESFFKTMSEVKILLPLLQAFDYFRHYDFYTYRHILIVFAMTSLIAQDIIPKYKSFVSKIVSSTNHDIGKICLPLNVLQKTNPLTRTERGLLEHHSAAGYVLLNYYLKDAHSFYGMVARDHHERKDGSGYPRGIKLRDEIVEIITVCDIYDALVSPRPYRPISYDNRTAIEELTAMAERKEIGLKAVRVLVSHNRKDSPSYSQVNISLEKRGTPPPGNLYGIIKD
ncbi:MAG: hypothetical protein LLF28_01965 [Nitrospiraceae bacterium]|nr:hypothetical protein [Nitrospiraceae bacterium]